MSSCKVFLRSKDYHMISIEQNIINLAWDWMIIITNSINFMNLLGNLYFQTLTMFRKKMNGTLVLWRFKIFLGIEILHLHIWQCQAGVLPNKNNEMIEERLSSSILRKTISEPQTGTEPATFGWPVRRSNHWATKTQMERQDAIVIRRIGLDDRSSIISRYFQALVHLT